MFPQTITFLVLIFCINLWQSQEVESVRLCGQKLADLLNYICQNSGGFHSPSHKQTEENISERSEGVVEECCRKSCSQSTLLSYCAGPTNEDISFLNNLNNINANEDTYIVENQEFGATTSSFLEYSNIQPINIGQTVRNRPIFIVLPQAEEISSEDFKI
ncbi:bombyxin B-2-like [Parasteatoda tepidariorum]|uniref:bombyxin B-2-like n=1 Tax=Parasteatoda tepidariorum TaxID=114398 RepID=UPI00077F9B1D|nr:bombyxin B-2-like [Parasteatoda tepidariorum]